MKQLRVLCGWIGIRCGLIKLGKEDGAKMVPDAIQQQQQNTNKTRSSMFSQNPDTEKHKVSTVRCTRS